jgi:hypothetical protein
VWLLLARAQERGAAPSEPIGALRAELAEERAARALLAAKVARLEGELAALRTSAARVPEAAPPAGRGPSAGPASEDAARAGEPARGSDPPARAFFDARRLAAAGLPERDVGELRRLFEETELERLYLRDQAAREGWPRGRLDAEIAALDQRLLSVRQDYGEDAYDWFLYAAGRPNRVVVESILGGSAADEAGLRAGDVLYAYGGQRLFEPEELVQSTHEGRLHESVEVEVERAGGRVRLTLPRGPLGVKVAGRSLAPDAAAER